MLKLFLLRHTQTEFSRTDRFCGTIDTPLDRVGRLQARAFARRHAGRAWAGIYTSSRRRAQETARPVAESCRMPPRIDPRLDEINYGEWQGWSKTELLARAPEQLRRWLRNPCVGAPGGESVGRVANRMLAAVAEIRRRHPHGNVLLVSHKTALRALICALLGLPLASYRDRIPQSEGALTIIDWTAHGPWLRVLADTRYLRGGALSDGSLGTEVSAVIQGLDAGYGGAALHAAR